MVQDALDRFLPRDDVLLVALDMAFIIDNVARLFHFLYGLSKFRKILERRFAHPGLRRRAAPGRVNEADGDAQLFMQGASEKIGGRRKGRHRLRRAGTPAVAFYLLDGRGADVFPDLKQANARLNYLTAKFFTNRANFSQRIKDPQRILSASSFICCNQIVKKLQRS